jgi:uncharacterized membrane protein
MGREGIMLKNSRIAFYVTIILLLFLGGYQVAKGDVGLGIGLIAGAIGVFSVKMIQFKRVAALESQGKVVYDERSIYLTSKASLAAIRIYVLMLAVLVLAGSIFFPADWVVNPWDLIGVLLAILVFLWIGFYYYYNREE